MKRIQCFVLVLVMISYIVPVSVRAAQQETIYFENGSYIRVYTEKINTRATQSVTGNKVYTYYDGSGNLDWKAVLSGTFTYTGSSSICTASSVNVTVYDSAWYTISKSAGKSGNSATAAVTIGRKVLGVTVERLPIEITLSCDANGNLS